MPSFIQNNNCAHFLLIHIENAADFSVYLFFKIPFMSFPTVVLNSYYRVF